MISVEGDDRRRTDATCVSDLMARVGMLRSELETDQADADERIRRITTNSPNVGRARTIALGMMTCVMTSVRTWRAEWHVRRPMAVLPSTPRRLR